MPYDVPVRCAVNCPRPRPRSVSTFARDSTGEPWSSNSALPRPLEAPHTDSDDGDSLHERPESLYEPPSSVDTPGYVSPAFTTICATSETRRVPAETISEDIDWDLTPLECQKLPPRLNLNTRMIRIGVLNNRQRRFREKYLVIP